MVNIKDIIDTISEVNGIRKDEISENKSLFRELGIWGDEAWDLIEALEKKYDVSMDDFRIADYFPPEGSFIFAFDWFIDVYKRYKPITVKELASILNEKIEQA
jgi:acyl carrier protein